MHNNSKIKRATNLKERMFVSSPSRKVRERMMERQTYGWSYDGKMIHVDHLPDRKHKQHFMLISNLNLKARALLL